MRTLEFLLAKAKRAPGRLLIGLDFDGTLAPLASRPGLARMPAETRRLLRALALNPRLRLAIVSGRSLRDVERRTRILGVYHAGNHGLEIHGPGLSWRHPRAERFLPIVREAGSRLQGELRGYPGILLEDKGLALSVHYRLADPRHLPAIRSRLKRLLRPWAGSLNVFPAKKTWEIRPIIAWDKGHALKKISGLDRTKGTIFFAGDDRTDEQGFRTLGPGAITVRIGGARRSAARFRLEDTRQVQVLLRRLVSL